MRRIYNGAQENDFAEFGGFIEQIVRRNKQLEAQNKQLAASMLIMMTKMSTMKSENGLYPSLSRQVSEFSTATSIESRRYELGDTLGFGRCAGARLGKELSKVNWDSFVSYPIPIAEFEKALLVHPGSQTYVIKNDGTLFVSKPQGMEEVKCPVKFTFLTGLHSYFAIDEDRKLWSWGLNQWNQLGRHLMRLDSEGDTKPRIIESLRNTRITQVAAFLNIATCVSEDSRLFIWGDCDELGLGSFSIPSRFESPTEITDNFNSPVLQVALGSAHLLVLCGDGLYAIGENESGQLGIGSKVDRPEFVKVETLNDKYITKIQCGAFCSAALTSNGEVYTWGRHVCGLEEDATNLPKLMEIDNVIDISVGEFHMLALDKDNHVFAWGLNKYGQCGVGLEDHHILTPTKLPGIEGCKILQLATGGTHSLVRYVSNNRQRLESV